MPAQSSVRVNSIVSLDGTGAPELTYGATIPSGQTVNIQGNLNITGVSTVGFISATHLNSTGIITASSFVGDGSNLTGTPVVSNAKSIALALIS